MIVIRVTEQNRGRADRAVARHFPDAGRKQIAALFAAGQVRIAGRVAKKGDPVAPGEKIEVRQPPPALAAVPDDTVPLAILYEDDAIVAVDKPPGIPSHPLLPGETGTIANALVAAYPGCATAADDRREGGLAHRLDTGTSGVLLAAKNPATWAALRRAFARGEVEKRYLAVACGALPARGHTRAALAHRKKKMIVTSQEAGLSAETTWEVVSRAGDVALVACTAHTGRMHQIRVHLAHLGAPLFGDPLYGGPPAPELGGHFLHAAEISLAHPVTGKRLTLRAPLPPSRAAFLDRLGLRAG